MLNFITDEEIVHEEDGVEFVTIPLPNYMTVNDLCEKYDLKRLRFVYQAVAISS